jgi:hypothetical protein
MKILFPKAKLNRTFNLVKVKEHVGCAPHTIKVMVGTRLDVGSSSRSRTAQPAKRISCLATAWRFAKTSCLLVFLVSSVARCSGAGGDASSKQRAATVSSVPQSVEHLQDANTPETQTAEDSSQDGLYVAAKTSSEITGQLQYNGTIAPESRQSVKNRQELQRLIAQVRSIKFEPKNLIPGPPRTIKPVLTSPQGEPSEVSSITQTTKQIVKKEGSELSLDSQPGSSQAAMDKPSYQPISAQTLQMLENLDQSAVEQLHNPMQLAEILFLSGHLKQAATFYQQALNRIDPNDAMSAQDKAWILFQIGNCLRESQDDQSKSRQVLDGAEAKKMYRRLIEECPNCPWADLAMSRVNLIDWFLNDEPEKLIEENKF